MKHTKVAIIGIGNVGASTAFALVLSNLASEIILVDKNQEKCAGQVKDLSDALAFTQTASVRMGTYADACTADIVIICAGVPQCVGQSRQELLQKNAGIIRSICAELQNIDKNALVIMVTNPLDTLTYLAQTLLPLDRNRIFGTGTWLDTQRLRRFLAERFTVSPQSIEAFMVGEHGDSSVAIVPPHLKLTQQEIIAVQEMVIKEAYTIIELKCATFYGIATTIADICSAIIHNQRRVLPLSIYNTEYDICISVPVILGENGTENAIPLTLSEPHKALFEKSVQRVKESNKSL